jgi:chorismate mutase-like protein
VPRWGAACCAPTGEDTGCVGKAMSITDWRRQIDEIDRKLVELLNQRSRCALEIGKIKQSEKLPLYQPEREREVLENAERVNSGPLTDAAVRRLFERIIDEARSAEREAMGLNDIVDKDEKSSVGKGARPKNSGHKSRR